MTDHAEEQEMEAEAMMAIFDTHFEILDPSDAIVLIGDTDDDNDSDNYAINKYDNHRIWRITIYPETGTTDEVEFENLNHVGCRLITILPETYPEIVPILHVEIIKGLAPEHRVEIRRIAMEEATNNIGTSSIYAITERVREWLLENNIKGLDDVSMHAQMMRKKVLEEKAKNKPQTIYETQKHSDEMTEAEREELEVTKRRAEGTPCTKENFEKWQSQFLQEMANRKFRNDSSIDDEGAGGKGKQQRSTKDKAKDIDRTGRMTGFEHFSNKMVDIEALELAAAEAEQGFEAGENLFEEDVDLDDLDFDEEDEDGEDDDDDEDDGDYEEDEDD